MTTALLVLAGLWVGTGIAGAVALVVLAYGDEVRVRVSARRMWRQVEEVRR